jgi:hypothetical protein
MVKFEGSSPETQPNLLRAQWFHDAGVGRGVDPEVAADIGYVDPSKHPVSSGETRQIPVEEEVVTTNLAFEDLGDTAARARGIVEDQPGAASKKGKSTGKSGKKPKPYRARYSDSTDRAKKQLDDVEAH